MASLPTNVIYPKFDVSSEEQEFLAKAQGYEILVRSKVWQDLKDHMDALVGEAEREMKAHTFDDPVKSMRLQMRWQQRGMMRDTLISHVESVIELRKEIIQRATEEPNGDYAGNT